MAKIPLNSLIDIVSNADMLFIIRKKMIYSMFFEPLRDDDERVKHVNFNDLLSPDADIPHCCLDLVVVLKLLDRYKKDLMVEKYDIIHINTGYYTYIELRNTLRPNSFLRVTIDVTELKESIINKNDENKLNLLMKCALTAALTTLVTNGLWHLWDLLRK